METEFPNRNTLILELAPGNIEQAIEDGLVEFGFTYLPSPNISLNFIEIGSFEMGIFGQKKWEKLPFKEWPFAVPITPLKINSIDHVSLDMWPRTKLRLIKYEFELLETALQTSRVGLSVLHCPSFIVTLHNRHLTNERKLSRLPFPDRNSLSKKVKIFLVAQKGNTATKIIEGKIAKFLRTLK